MKKFAIINFLQRINFKKINSRSQGDSLLFDRLTKDEYLLVADAIDRNIEEASDSGKNENKNEFYSIKNKTFDMSMAISNAFDGNFIIEAGKWIEHNKDYFGETILDVGCDCGILTCFIATLCPNSQVVGMDKTSLAIDNAKKLAAKLNINNVSFEVSAIENMPVSKFKTIFTSRTAHENGSPIKNFNKTDETEVMALKVKSFYQKYANDIVRLMNDDSNLIKISREDIGPRYLARLLAFQEAGLTWLSETYSSFSINDNEKAFDSPEYFQFSIFRKEKDIRDIRTQYLNHCLEIGLFSTEDDSYFTGDCAKLYFSYLCGEPILGYKILTTDGELLEEHMCYIGLNNRHFRRCFSMKQSAYMVHNVREENINKSILIDDMKKWEYRKDIKIEKVNL